MNTYLQYFENCLEDMLMDVAALVNLDSPSRQKDLVDSVLHTVVRRAQEMTDAHVEYYRNDTHGDTAKLTIGEGARQVLVLGHIDTVWPQGEAVRRPFRRDGRRAYGPGIFDMKCGIVQGIYALAALGKISSIPCKVCFLINSDEEIGSPSSRVIIEEHAIQSEAVFVLEPALGLEGALKTARKGVGRFTMSITGIPAHSGIDHEKGVSAIEELAHQIIYLHGLTDYEVGSTVNVGQVTGGTAANVVAGVAQAEIDLRVTSLTEAGRLEELIRSLKSNHSNTRIDITGGIKRPPMPHEASVRLYRQAEEIAESLGFSLSEASTGGASDGCITAALGVQTLDGLGAVGGGAHAYDEFIEIADIPRRSALLTQLICAQFGA